MRDELERVLDYAHIATRLASSGLQAADVLRQFDRQARLVEAPAKAPVTLQRSRRPECSSTWRFGTNAFC